MLLRAPSNSLLEDVHYSLIFPCDPAFLLITSIRSLIDSYLVVVLAESQGLGKFIKVL